jgi:hypothetical protein
VLHKVVLAYLFLGFLTLSKFAFLTRFDDERVCLAIEKILDKGATLVYDVPGVKEN